MANLHHPMDSQDMVNHHHPIMAMVSQLDPLSFTSIMTMMMVLPASSAAEIPTTLQEEKLDVLQLPGDAVCFISQEFCVACHVASMDARMFN